MPPASHSLNATSPKLTFNPPAGFSITLKYLSIICKLLPTEMEIIEFLPILAGSPVYFVISRIWTNAHFLVCLLSCHCLSIFNSLFSYLLSLILYFQLSVFSTFCIFNFCIFNFRIFNLLPVPFSTLISSEMSFPVSHDPFPVHFILNL